MKILRTITTVFTMFLISSTIASAQKIMKLNNDLKATSQPVEAKRKGMSSVGKYEFGPYKIVSGKGGWQNSYDESYLRI